MNIKQGEIWWIDPTPKMGSEQRGKRPALIIQNNIANKYLKTTIIAIISSSGKIMPEMVPVDYIPNITKNSCADFAQIFTIDKTRLLSKVGEIDTQDWLLVEKALGRIFKNTLGL